MVNLNKNGQSHALGCSSGGGQRRCACSCGTSKKGSADDQMKAFTKASNEGKKRANP